MKPRTQRRSLLNNLFLIIVFGAFAVFRLLPVISQQHLVSTAVHHETVQAMPYSENYQSIRGSTDSNTIVAKPTPPKPAFLPMSKRKCAAIFPSPANF